MKYFEDIGLNDIPWVDVKFIGAYHDVMEFPIDINEILDKYNLSDNIIKAKDLADVVLEFLKSLDDDVTVKFEIEKQYTYIYLKKRNDKERDMLIYKSKFEGIDLYM